MQVVAGTVLWRPVLGREGRDAAPSWQRPPLRLLHPHPCYVKRSHTASLFLPLPVTADCVTVQELQLEVYHHGQAVSWVCARFTVDIHIFKKNFLLFWGVQLLHASRAGGGDRLSEIWEKTSNPELSGILGFSVMLLSPWIQIKVTVVANARVSAVCRVLQTV